MTKYKQLVKEYEKEILEIKKLKQELEEKTKELNLFEKENQEKLEVFEKNTFEKLAGLKKEWRDVEGEYTSKLYELNEDIRNEYGEVAFRKTAEQGVTGFWRLANSIIDGDDIE
jgi:chromosome segregation ATPase